MNAKSTGKVLIRLTGHRKGRRYLVKIKGRKLWLSCGPGSINDVQAALQWVCANAAAFNVAAVNMSIGDDTVNSQVPLTSILSDEFMMLDGLGVTLVTSAGNAFFDLGTGPGVTYPAADQFTIAVGATLDEDVGALPQPNNPMTQAVNFTTDVDEIAAFSQRHPLLMETMAPGAVITAGVIGGGSDVMSGTSMAAPHVTGVAVLAQQLAMQNRDERLTVAEVRALLNETSVPIVDSTPPQDDNVTNTNLTYRRFNANAFIDEVFEDTWTIGDFDYSQEVDDADIDILYDAIFARIPSLPYHDLTMDSSVNQDDMDFLIHDVLNTLYGDADVDGDTDMFDIILVFQAGKYLTGEEALWAEGDWDGDRLFDQDDVVKALQDGAFQPVFEQLFGPFANQLPLEIKVLLLDAFLRLGGIFF